MAYYLRVEKEYLKFSAAHFTLYREGRESLHGHNYAVSLELEANALRDGFVIDFQPLKACAREVCESLDEKVLLPNTPRVLLEPLEEGLRAVVDSADEYRFPRGETVTLPIENITCEGLAFYVAQRLIDARAQWDEQSRVARLRVWVQETPGQRGGFEAVLDQ